MADKPHVVVIRAGAGGLSAAIDLGARMGSRVTVLERAERPGGKIRAVPVGDALVDGGPTVFTMRWIFEGLFEDAGKRLEDRLTLKTADVLARHAWAGGGRLDRSIGTSTRSAEAISAFAGATEADGYRRFCRDAADIFATLKDSFHHGQRPSQFDLVQRVGVLGMPALFRTRPWETLWHRLGHYFRDERLRQLFGRYATYVGSSPLQAPTTLMLIAHVEQDGVWLVEGGMRRLAEAMARSARRSGSHPPLRRPCRPDRDRRAPGLPRRAGGWGADRRRRHRLQWRYLGPIERFVGTGSHTRGAGCCTGEPLPFRRHVVPASQDERLSFGAPHGLLRRSVSAGVRGHLPRPDHRGATDGLRLRPGPGRCGHGRTGGSGAAAGTDQRAGGRDLAPQPEMGPETRLLQKAFGLMEACGLTVERDGSSETLTTPEGFNALFPSSGGALYGRANHGASASFDRMGAASRIRGLYLAGRSVHPGAACPWRPCRDG